MFQRVELHWLEKSIAACIGGVKIEQGEIMHYFKERLLLLKSYYFCIGRDFPENEKEVEVLVRETLLPEGCGNPVDSYFLSVEVPEELNKAFLFQWLSNTYGRDWRIDIYCIFTHLCDPRLLELTRVGCKVFRSGSELFGYESLCLTYPSGWIKCDYPE